MRAGGSLSGHIGAAVTAQQPQAAGQFFLSAGCLGFAGRQAYLPGYSQMICPVFSVP